MQKCCSIRKGTTKRESAEVLFHSEMNNKKWKCRSVVPFGKEQQKVKLQKYSVRNNKTWKCRGAVPFGKEQQNVKKEQQNESEKWTVDTQGVVLLKKEQQNKNVVPLEKEQQKQQKCTKMLSLQKRNSKMHKHKMQARKEWISCSLYWCWEWVLVWMKQHLKHKISERSEKKQHFI